MFEVSVHGVGAIAIIRIKGSLGRQLRNRDIRKVETAVPITFLVLPNCSNTCRQESNLPVLKTAIVICLINGKSTSTPNVILEECNDPTDIHQTSAPFSAIISQSQLVMSAYI